MTKRRRLLAPEDFDTIHSLLAEGVPQTKIAERFDVNQTFISRVKRGEVTKESYHYGEGHHGKVVANRPSQNYTREEIERALLEVALCAGNVGLAAKRLDEAGLRPRSPATLRDWVTVKYAARYGEIEAEQAPKLEAAIVRSARERIAQADEAQRLLLEQLIAQLEAGEVKDLSKAARDVATVFGINVSRYMEATGRPTVIVEHRTADDILSKWRQRGVIDVTAEEIEPQQLPPGSAGEGGP